MARKLKQKAVPVANIDPATLKRITEAIVHIDAEKAEFSKDRSEYSKEARENLIHAKAHNFIIALLKLSPADRHLCLECFDSYRGILKLDAWQSEADKQSDIEDMTRKAAA